MGRSALGGASGDAVVGLRGMPRIGSRFLFVVVAAAGLFGATTHRRVFVAGNDASRWAQIEALVDQNLATAHDRVKLVSLSVVAGTRGPQRATMKLQIDGGRPVTEEAEGNGPVDATFNAIKELVPHEAVLELYQVHAVTEGTDAQAEVSVRLSSDGRSVTGRGADPDTLVASAQAYLGAPNKLLARGASLHAQHAAE